MSTVCIASQKLRTPSSQTLGLWHAWRAFYQKRRCKYEVSFSLTINAFPIEASQSAHVAVRLFKKCRGAHEALNIFFCTLVGAKNVPARPVQAQRMLWDEAVFRETPANSTKDSYKDTSKKSSPSPRRTHFLLAASVRTDFAIVFSGRKALPGSLVFALPRGKHFAHFPQWFLRFIVISLNASAKLLLKPLTTLEPRQNHFKNTIRRTEQGFLESVECAKYGL